MNRDATPRLKREHLRRERELADYARKLTAAIKRNPGYGALMARKSREKRHKVKIGGGRRGIAKYVKAYGEDDPKLTSGQVAKSLGRFYVKPPWTPEERVG